MKTSKKITLWSVMFVAIVAILLMAATEARAEQPEDLHCPTGWLAKLEVDPLNWEVAIPGSYGMSSDTGFLYSLLNIWSDTHTLTGFCVKAGPGNTGILPMSALPYYKDDPAISHVVIYGEQEYQTCDATIPGEKVFGDWYELTDEIWNDWIYDDNIRTRTGRQSFARDWTQNFYDARDGETICEVKEGKQFRGQLLKETEEKECLQGMYLLPGLRYPCYLNQNKTDSPWSIPQRYVGEYGLTSYAQGLCNQIFTCDGWKTGVFQWTGEWEFVCTWKPCLDCDK